MNESTPNYDLRPNGGTYRAVQRSNEPNKHIQTIQWAKDSVSIEHEGANQGDGVLTGS